MPVPVADVPAAVVTVTLTVPAACDGATAVICVSELNTKFVAGTAPKLTPVVPVKLVPVRMTMVPPPVLPEVGLSEVVLPLTGDTPSESELRLAQAQLVGWLEGLFHGIQATLFTQQAMAQSQFEEMRRRHALDPGLMGAPQHQPPSGYL